MKSIIYDPPHGSRSSHEIRERALLSGVIGDLSRTAPKSISAGRVTDP